MTLTGDDFAGWQPHRPPWYPADLPEPSTIVLVASGDVVTNYAKWERGLEPGELRRRIRETTPCRTCGAPPGECFAEPMPCGRFEP